MAELSRTSGPGAALAARLIYPRPIDRTRGRLLLDLARTVGGIGDVLAAGP